METDVLIIGGGAAGLAAAYELASRGVEVAVVDEGRSLGGQFKQQTQMLKDLGMRGFEYITKLIHDLTELKVKFFLNHTFIGTYEDQTIGLSNGEEIFPVKAKRIILAVGAAEKPLAFPGWTFPGVITLGAAQIMINRERVLPGKRAVILGSSDFAFELASQLQDVGVEVKGIYERKDRLQLKEASLAKEIPFYIGVEVEHVRGHGEAEGIDFIQGEKKFSVETDFICVDGGRMPIIESFEILDCQIAFQEELGGWLPVYDSRFETSVDSIYVAGNSAGITTQGGVVATGIIAGISVAESLSVLSTEEAESLRKARWNDLKKIETKWDEAIFQGRVSHIEKGRR